MTRHLAPAPLLERAADIIARNGLAKNNYVQVTDGVDPNSWPVDVQAALAMAAGLEPVVWEDADHHGREMRPVTDACDALIDYYGLDPIPAYDDVIGGWSDAHDADTIVPKLRDAAHDLAAVFLVWSHDARAWWKPDGHGYTGDVWQAGRYTREKATEACGRRSWTCGELPPEVIVAAPEDGGALPLTGAEFQQVADLMRARINHATARAVAAGESREAVPSA